jgi:hypothetical protein
VFGVPYFFVGPSSLWRDASQKNAEAAEKVRIEQESNTSGAKARHILNRLRPD